MITPAILENKPEKFKETLKSILTLKNLNSIQIDFADGEFVPTKSLSIENIIQLKQLVKHSNKIEFEAHLMIDSPKEFSLYQKCGFKKIIVHYESFKSELDLEAALEEIRKLKMTPAVAISPTSQVSVIRYHVDTINDFTLVTVNPGKQGQKMLSDSISRLIELRDLAPGANIEVDGGVNIKNIAQLIDAGATNCVVGSSLLKGDIKTNYQLLLESLK